MTTSSGQPIPPVFVPAAADALGGGTGGTDSADDSDRELVGESDAEADAGIQPANAERDSDGVPVGRADLEADKARSAEDRG
jgi:hypothetical protein